MVYRFSALVFVVFLFVMKPGACRGYCSKPSIYLKYACESAWFWIQKLREVRVLEGICICC